MSWVVYLSARCRLQAHIKDGINIFLFLLYYFENTSEHLKSNLLNVNVIFSFKMKQIYNPCKKKFYSTFSIYLFYTYRMFGCSTSYRWLYARILHKLIFGVNETFPLDAGNLIRTFRHSSSFPLLSAFAFATFKTSELNYRLKWQHRLNE